MSETPYQPTFEQKVNETLVWPPQFQPVDPEIVRSQAQEQSLEALRQLAASQAETAPTEAEVPKDTYVAFIAEHGLNPELTPAQHIIGAGTSVVASRELAGQS